MLGMNLRDLHMLSAEAEITYLLMSLESTLGWEFGVSVLEGFIYLFISSIHQYLRDFLSSYMIQDA